MTRALRLVVSSLCAVTLCACGSSGGPRAGDGGEVLDLSAAPSDAGRDGAIDPNVDLAGTGACPPTLPMDQTDCTDQYQDPKGPRPCAYGTGACAITCGCSSFLLQGPMWRCPTPVGPTCGPSPNCPRTPPVADGTQTSTSAPYTLCSYADATPGCTETCQTLDTGGGNLTWHCNFECACPPAPIIDGVACTQQGVGTECQYGAGCASSCICGGTTLNGFHWDCAVCGTASCPATPPATGESCDPQQVRDACYYEQKPYCGECKCDSASKKWQCPASTCDACPQAKPLSGTSCGDIGHYQSCKYQSPNVTCMCSGTGTSTWACN